MIIAEKSCYIKKESLVQFTGLKIIKKIASKVDKTVGPFSNGGLFDQTTQGYHCT